MRHGRIHPKLWPPGSLRLPSSSGRCGPSGRRPGAAKQRPLDCIRPFRLKRHLTRFAAGYACCRPRWCPSKWWPGFNRMCRSCGGPNKSAPRLLFHGGRFFDDAMRRERVVRAEVLQAVRSAGHSSLTRSRRWCWRPTAARGRHRARRAGYGHDRCARPGPRGCLRASKAARASGRSAGPYPFKPARRAPRRTG